MVRIWCAPAATPRKNTSLSVTREFGSRAVNLVALSGAVTHGWRWARGGTLSPAELCHLLERRASAFRPPMPLRQNVIDFFPTAAPVI